MFAEEEEYNFQYIQQVYLIFLVCRKLLAEYFFVNNIVNTINALQ